MARVNPKPAYWDETGERIVRLKVNGEYERVNTGTSYLVYTAKIRQASTDAPVATIYGSNTIGDIVFSRTSEGIYPMTLADAFPEGRTVIFPFDLDPTGDGNAYIPFFSNGSTLNYFQIGRTSTSVLTIVTIGADFSFSEMMGSLSFEIRVYPT